MLLIVLAAVALSVLAPQEYAQRAIVWFVAAECTLSYVTAGLVITGTWIRQCVRQ